jgi:hypothetical protein
MKNRKVVLFLLVSLVGLSGLGCARKNESPTPLVSDLVEKNVSVNTFSGNQNAVSLEVTLAKSALLGREFLYGGSLQFSSLKEDNETTALMAIALGQFPARFRLNPNSLLLETDGSLAFESDVNQPSRLIHEFPLLRQTADTVTIAINSASPLLDTFLWGENQTVPKRASWLRSSQFVEGSELFLLESSVELADGSLAEFMETIQPREKIVPKGAQALLNDKELNPLAERFRFLDPGKVFIANPDKSVGGKIATKVAQRFFPAPGEPIRFWITRNAPEKYLNDVKNGIEAWNRYSKAMERSDLVRFEGYLPENVKVGDPRYNILVWDTVQDAGAAYASSSADPITGVISHTLVYIPLAWINEGHAFWERAQLTESKGEKRSQKLAALFRSRTVGGRALPVHCLDRSHMHVDLQSRKSPEEFGRSLLKGVVFHEIGHSLGLAHNFKGSLAFDPEQGGKTTTTSVMDYNQYHEEAGTFARLDTADGPILEYDRQIISVLYNEGKDLKKEDPELPACDDEEADSEEGGVDPLCVRYDIGKNPAERTLLGFALLSDSNQNVGRLASLPSSLARVAELLPEADSIKDKEALEEQFKAWKKTMRGTASIYISSSASSLAYLSSQAMRGLRVFKEGVFPESSDEVSFREQSLQVLENALSTESLPAASAEAWQKSTDAFVGWAMGTVAFNGLDEAAKTELTDLWKKEANELLATVNEIAFTRLRTRIWEALKHSEGAPFSFHQRQGEAMDLEAVVLNALREALKPTLKNEGKRSNEERKTALESLIGYKGIEQADRILSEIGDQLAQEIREAKDASLRQELRSLLNLIKK